MIEFQELFEILKPVFGAYLEVQGCIADIITIMTPFVAVLLARRKHKG